MLGGKVGDDGGDNLLPRPQQLGFLNGGRKQFDTSRKVDQSSKHVLLVLASCEEPPSHGHLDGGYHVILDQTLQRCSILGNQKVPAGGNNIVGLSPGHLRLGEMGVHFVTVKVCVGTCAITSGRAQSRDRTFKRRCSSMESL